MCQTGLTHGQRLRVWERSHNGVVQETQCVNSI
jgi:hypothetical protein